MPSLFPCKHVSPLCERTNYQIDIIIRSDIEKTIVVIGRVATPGESETINCLKGVMFCVMSVD